MSDPTPTTKEERQAAAEQRRTADEQAAQRADQAQAALRQHEGDVLAATLRAAQSGVLDWATIADALERATAAARALAGNAKK